MKTGSEHSAVNIPKSWLRGFNHDSEKKNLAIGTGVAAAASLVAVQPCSASAQEVLFAETIQVERYTGTFQKNFILILTAMAKKKQLVITMLVLKEMAILYQMFILYLTQIRIIYFI